MRLENFWVPYVTIKHGITNALHKFIASSIENLLQTCRMHKASPFVSLVSSLHISTRNQDSQTVCLNYHPHFYGMPIIMNLESCITLKLSFFPSQQ